MDILQTKLIKPLFPFLFFTFLLTFFSVNYAQVKIKEKVEIKPLLLNGMKTGKNNKTTGNQYLPCGPYKPSYDLYNPWQIVWFHSSYHLDPGQQPFNYQANDYSYLSLIDSTKYYDFVVTEGKDKCHIMEYFKTYPDSARDAGYELRNISGMDMLGERSEFDTDKIRRGFQKYAIFFDSPGDVTFTINEVGSYDIYNFHTKIVKPDSYTLEYTIDGEIPHGEEQNINLTARRDQCPNDDVLLYTGGGYYGKYNYEITQGSEYAVLVREYFDDVNFANIRETGTAFTNLTGNDENVYLWMNGKEPDSSAVVKVRLSGSETTVSPVEVTTTVVKNENYPLQVIINPNELTMGDTADVILRKRITEYATSDSAEYEDFPGDQLFDVTIEKGKEYADIYLPTEGLTGDSFELVYQGFKLIIPENIDTTNVEIKIRVTTHLSDDTQFNTEEGNTPLKIKTGKKKDKNTIAIIGVPTGKEIFGIGKATIGNNIIVQFEPAELFPGDTALVKIYKKDSGGNLVEYPAEQRYEIGILEGCEYGDLLVNDTMDVYFSDVTGPIKYIAADSTGTDTAKVTLRVGLIPSDGNTTLRKAAKNRDETAASYCSISGFVYNNYDTATTAITPVIQILLGETKYFGVQKKTEKNEIKELRIIEIKPKDGESKPEFSVIDTDGWEWIKNDEIWGAEPVTTVKGKNYGKKQGIYWERKYPVYSQTNHFQGMEDLDAGMIRIIGRYWHQDSTYVVKLKAKSGALEKSLKIKVVKPKTIGPKKNKLIDVKGQEYNLDELILKYAGLNGVPPQIIKGIIEKESGFTNAMRWEPFFEIRYNIHSKDKNGNFTYWAMTKSRYTIKSENDIGDPTIPTEHININNATNLYPKEYWGYQGSVWDLFYKNCKEFNPNADSDIYNSKFSSWTRGLKEGWDKEFNKAYKKYLNKKVPSAEIDSLKPVVPYSFAYQYAFNHAKYWVKNIYLNGRMGEPAQTRIATSYGLMQVIYTSATKYWNYPKDYYSDPTPQIPSYLPEYLNDKEISLKYGTEGINYYVNKEIEYKNNDKDNNWTAGFERTFVIGLYGYNHGFNKNSNKRYINKGYGYDVLKRAQKYLPSK